ncbi:dihydrofolate reductase [Hathewaya histolytica]|uniref:Dihydrofolate reductase n=1 Tax=Hathewaya histolytica TaxID=1498 RepID=A0A4U9QYY7_HATHI|nr:dihydrofolate reductase [Hathewaya histolytica]VTQ83368.1 dihydrofolate reductase [Hathewaya histolytica]
MLSIIVAIANNNVIGRNNKLIWHIPEDLKRFKRITKGKKIIMGRNTFESLPGVLPEREHIVLTRDKNYTVDNENVKIINNIEELDTYIKDDEEHFIIGGGTIYELFIPHSSNLYLTRIYEDFKGDTFFPEYDEDQWELLESEKGLQNESNPYDYDYLTYKRKTEDK